MEPEVESSRLVQHVILRKDLTKAPFSWPAGSMIAQGCHVVCYIHAPLCMRIRNVYLNVVFTHAVSAPVLWYR